MNYRHGYHAGNFADVLKHVALVAILRHLKKKDTAFSVIDTHAGRGLYDLRDAAPQATGESEGGIGRLADLKAEGALGDYLALVKECGKLRYPGSPLIAAQMLRPQDRLVAIEKHPDEAKILADVLAPFTHAVAENTDGYARVSKLLPPPSRRGLILIDPPFEATDEFETLARTLAAAVRKFANGIYLVWYPIKSQSAADAFMGEVLAAGVSKALTCEIAVDPHPTKMTRAGVLVINPPYGLSAELELAAALLAPRLGNPAEIRVTWRAGSE